MYTFNSQVDPIQLGKKYFKTQFEQSSHLEVCLLFSRWLLANQCQHWGFLGQFEARLLPFMGLPSCSSPNSTLHLDFCRTQVNLGSGCPSLSERHF